MKTIPLGRDGTRVALVDDADYDTVIAAGRWSYHNGYAARLVRGQDPSHPQRIYMHRVILKAPAGSVTDHRDFDGLNNTRANIRVCSYKENQRHSRKRRTYNGRPTQNRYKGVHRANPVGNRWCARIRYEGRYLYIGTFRGERQAATAYRLVAERLHGAYAHA